MMTDNKSTPARKKKADETQIISEDQLEEVMSGEETTGTDVDNGDASDSSDEPEGEVEPESESDSIGEQEPAPPLDEVESIDEEGPPEEHAEESVEDVQIEVTPIDAEEPLMEAVPTGLPSETRTEYRGVSRWGAFWYSAGCSGIALVIAVVSTLGIIAGLNDGSLIFTTPAEMNSLSLEVDGIDKTVSSLAQDVSSLHTRVDNLEALSGRMNELESSIQEIDQQMVDVADQVSSMEHTVQELSQRVEDLVKDISVLQETNTRFQGFFEGLRELLGNLFEAEGTQ